MKKVLTKADVEKAINGLIASGKKPTLSTIHASLNNRGSLTTLIDLKAEIDAAAQIITDSPEALKVFREVWALAQDENRQLLAGAADELRETIRALSIENERVEGLASAAQNQAADAEHAKSQAEGELTRIKCQLEAELKQSAAALAAASVEAAGAFRSLAEAHAAHATELNSLKSEIAAATQNSHEFELQVARTTALLEAKIVELRATPAKKCRSSNVD